MNVAPEELRLYVLLLKHLSIETPSVFWYDGRSIIGNIFFKLLPFLADPSFNNLQKNIRDTITSLLNLLRTGHLAAYRSFIKDTVQLLKLLCDILIHFQDLDIESEPIIVNCYNTLVLTLDFQNISESDTIESPNENYFLQIDNVHSALNTIENLTKLFTVQIKKVPQFLEDISKPIWDILLIQIERGNIDVKKSSLTCLNSFISSCKIPSIHQYDFLISFITLLLPKYNNLRTKEIEYNISTCMVQVIQQTSLDTLQIWGADFLQILPDILSQELIKPVQVSIKK